MYVMPCIRVLQSHWITVPSSAPENRRPCERCSCCLACLLACACASAFVPCRPGCHALQATTWYCIRHTTADVCLCVTALCPGHKVAGRVVTGRQPGTQLGGHCQTDKSHRCSCRCKSSSCGCMRVCARGGFVRRHFGGSSSVRARTRDRWPRTARSVRRPTHSVHV